jgi:copper resistance protein B
MRPILTLSLALTLSAAHGQDAVPTGHQQHPTETNAPAKADAHKGHSSMTMPGEAMPNHGMMSQPTIDPKDAEYLPYDLKDMGAGPFGLLLLDQLEYRLGQGDDQFRWDAEGWYGGDFNRFWFKTEGEQTVQGPSAGRAEIHGYYSRLIAPFWDAQIGLRYDQLWEPGNDPSRFFAAIGVQGFAPYRFEVTPALFISEEGDFSARLTTSKEYRITQRLVAQGRFETEIAAQDVPKFGVGEGFNSVELGLRLRYEIRREFAPYIGVSWERKLGQTADFARQAGENPDVLHFVVGLRLWF